MEQMLPLLDENPRAFCVKLALNLSIKHVQSEAVPESVIERLCNEIKLHPEDMLLCLPFVFFQEAPLPVAQTIFSLLPQSLPALLFISCRTVTPLEVSAARLALKRPFSLENFAICSLFCADDLLYRSHLKNAFNTNNNSTFGPLFEEIFLLQNPGLEPVLRLELGDLHGLTDFNRFQLIFQALLLRYDFSEVFAELEPRQYINAVYTLPKVCVKVAEYLQLEPSRLERTEIGTRLCAKEFNQKAYEYILENIDLLLLRFTAINQDFHELPQFWNIVPPARRESNELVELVDSLIDMAKGRPICKFSVQNALGRIPIAFSQMESINTFEKAITLFEAQEIEGIPAEWLPQVLLLFALLNRNTRYLAAEKLRFSLQNEIFSQFEDFPGIFGESDLRETFEFDFYVPQDGVDEKELLLNMDIAEVLEYDDNESFVNGKYYEAFFELFRDLPNLAITDIKQYRQVFEKLLCQKAVLSTFTVNFIDASPSILIHIILKFLEVSFSENLDLASCFMFYIIEFSSVLSLFFQEDSSLRGAAGRILLQEVKYFAAMQTITHVSLTPQQTSYILEVDRSNSKIESFYQVEETYSSVSVALTLEKALNMEKLSSSLFEMPKYQKIGCFIDHPTTDKEIVWFEIIQKCYFDYISRLADLTQVLQYLQHEFVAPVSSNVLFLKALQLFDLAFSRSISFDFKVKTGVLTFANGILGLERGKEFTNYAVRLYLKILARYVQGEKSTNLCQIISHICHRLINNSLDYFEPLVLEVLQLLCYCGCLPDNFDIQAITSYSSTGVLTTEGFRQLLSLMRLYAANCQLEGDTVGKFEHMIEYIMQEPTQLFESSAPICDLLKEVERKMELLIEPNVEEMVELRSSIASLQKLVLQELYFCKPEKPIIQEQYDVYYAELLLQILKTDFLHVVEGRTAGNRRSQRAEYIRRFASVIHNVNQAEYFREFLKIAKKSVLTQFFSEQNGILYFQRLAGEDSKAADCVWTCYEEYFQFYADDGFKADLLRELSKFGVELLQVAHLDLMCKLSINDGDFYQRKQFAFLPFNYCFYLLQNAFERAEIEKSLILCFISNVLCKTDISMEFIQLCKKLQQALHYQGSSSEKIALAFLCHVRNCMDANDAERSEVLPGALIKCIKEALPRES